MPSDKTTVGQSKGARVTRIINNDNIKVVLKSLALVERDLKTAKSEGTPVDLVRNINLISQSRRLLRG